MPFLSMYLPEGAYLPQSSEKQDDLEAADEDCSICFEHMTKDDARKGRLFRLQCHHVFHTACIGKWYRNNPTCPDCNAPISEDTPDDDVVSIPRNNEQRIADIIQHEEINMNQDYTAYEHWDVYKGHHAPTHTYIFAKNNAEIKIVPSTIKKDTLFVNQTEYSITHWEILWFTKSRISTFLQHNKNAITEIIKKQNLTQFRGYKISDQWSEYHGYQRDTWIFKKYRQTIKISPSATQENHVIVQYPNSQVSIDINKWAKLWFPQKKHQFVYQPNEDAIQAIIDQHNLIPGTEYNEYSTWNRYLGKSQDGDYWIFYDGVTRMSIFPCVEDENSLTVQFYHNWDTGNDGESFDIPIEHWAKEWFQKKPTSVLRNNENAIQAIIDKYTPLPWKQYTNYKVWDRFLGKSKNQTNPVWVFLVANAVEARIFPSPDKEGYFVLETDKAYQLPIGVLESHWFETK